MKASLLILLAVFLTSCTTSPRTTCRSSEPQFDQNIRMVEVGGFKLQMTARAAQAVIKAKSYRENSRNLETLEDLALNPGIQYAIVDVFEFSYGESLDDRLLRETGTFSLHFCKGRVEGITYGLVNLTKEKLKKIRERNEETFHFVIERETNHLDAPVNGTAISWKYSAPNLAFLRINYVERKPRFAAPQLGDSAVGSCEYSIAVFANPNLIR
jgi:hypothetical protein